MIRSGRTKERYNATPTAREKAYFAQIAAMPCLVCGANATVHHVTAGIHGGRVTRRHDRVVPLCPRHHQIQHGPRDSVEALGHGGFYRKFGIDLMAVAERLAP